MGQKKENGFGIAAMVLGIIGLITSCIVIGVLPSILGFIFAIIALNRNNYKQGTSIAGLVCSIIGLLISVIVIIGIIVSGDDEPVKKEDKAKITYSESIQSSEIEDNAGVTDSEEKQETEGTTNQFEYDGMVVKYLNHEIMKDSLGRKVLVVYYDFTNNSKENQTFEYEFSDKCFQNGVEVEHTYFGVNEEVGNSGKEIKPGTTVKVASSFVLGDCMDNVELEVEPLITFKKNVSLSVDLKLE